jgi:O-antigen/teichoic acid export membrane protein
MKRILTILTIFLPLFAFAQGQTQLVRILSSIRDWLNIIIPILVILSLIYFIWGVIRFVIQGNEETKKEAKEQVIYGLIGIFVLLSVYGIINLIGKTLNVNQGGSGRDLIPYLTEPGKK